MPTYQVGVDVSNYTGVISAQAVRDLQAANCMFVIAGTQNPSITRSQLATAKLAGFDIAAYVYLYFGYDVRGQVEDALSQLVGFSEARLWLDVEDQDNNLSQEQVTEKVVEAVDTCTAERRHWGIYTSRSKWNVLIGGNDIMRSGPLWDAFYDGVDTFDYFKPYGPWQEPSIKQYAGDARVGELLVDLNVRQKEGVW